MKVVLINPPHPYLIRPDSQAPLGLLYLGAALREAGHEPRIANLSRFDVDEAVAQLPLDADLYGMTATCVDYSICERLARALRKLRPDAKIVLGGPHTTVAADTIDLEAFDSYCVGEGEQAIVRMVDDLADGRLASRYVGSRIGNLDDIPFPARDLIDVLGGGIFSGGEHLRGNVSTVIITARGCPFDCTFCASRPIWGGNLTYRSVENVIEEVRQVRDEFGVREFRFCDDMLNLRPGRLEELCDGMRKLDVLWRGSIRAGISDADTYKMMYDAGCRELSPGVESGDQRVLEFLSKRTTVQDNRNLIQWAGQAGINVRVLLMSGTPGEHHDTPEINRDFLASIDYASVSVTQFRPIPGSPIWNHPERFGCRILSKDLDRYNFYFWERGPNAESVPAKVEAVIETDLLTKAEMEANMLRMRDYVLATGKCNRV